MKYKLGPKRWIFPVVVFRAGVYDGVPEKAWSSQLCGAWQSQTNVPQAIWK